MNLSRFTDAYFLRSVDLLAHLHINPIIRAQLFFRHGPGKLAGVNEVLDLLRTNTTLFNNNGKVYSLQESDSFSPLETVMVIEGCAQDVIPVETVVLGILSSRTTQLNTTHTLDFPSITTRTRLIKNLIGERQLLYFGARHWHYSDDEAISRAVFEGGATAASTNVGASVRNQKGMGTIPHSLENIFAWKVGKEKAVVKTTEAFDQIIDAEVPRIALVDYRNKEIDDALAVAHQLGNKLDGVRIDTCGENWMQGALVTGSEKPEQFWYGQGVKISGVYALRQALNEHGFSNVSIVLSSGFGNPKKVQAFVEAEKKLGIQLFDSLGVGNLFDAWIATMDVVSVGNNVHSMQQVSKVGRKERANPRLQRMI